MYIIFVGTQKTHLNEAKTSVQTERLENIHYFMLNFFQKFKT